jgi:uncharacterized membrane protein HdeD (DUF308 family)
MATEGSRPVVKAAKRYTGWYIVAAVLFILLGLFAIIRPAAAGLGVALLVGWLFVFGGVGHFIAAFEGGGARRVLLQILAGVAFVIGGLYLLMHPLLGLSSLTLLLAAVIIVAAVCEIVAYFRHKGEQASGWMLFNGIVALLVGGIIWLHWPWSSVWALGTLVGVNLLLTGIARLMLGLAGRRLIKQTA